MSNFDTGSSLCGRPGRVRAPLTVIGDGPVGAVGRQLADRAADEWAVGMKMVVDLPESCTPAPSTILHTFGWGAEDMGGVEGARAIEPLCQLWCAPGFLRNQWTHAFKLLKL